MWDAHFYYDETSLTYLRTKKVWVLKNGGVRREAGAVAGGSMGKRKYFRVYFEGHYYMAHRVVWELHNGAIPDGVQVDHIDGDRTNNRIGNLRLVTPAGNARNRKKTCKNTSGVVGVGKYLHKGVHVGWVAHWYEGGKMSSKYFSFKKHSEEAFEIACNFRSGKINASGDYSERHGQTQKE